MLTHGSVQRLAERLLAAEAACEAEERSPALVAVIVCKKIRTPLTKFAGADGFTALIRRAVSMARADVPSLKGVHVSADGSLHGLDDLIAGPEDMGAEGAIAITTRLLELLVTFIGQPLALRLVNDAWPDTTLQLDLEPI